MTGWRGRGTNYHRDCSEGEKDENMRMEYASDCKDDSANSQKVIGTYAIVR